MICCKGKKMEKCCKACKESKLHNSKPKSGYDANSKSAYKLKSKLKKKSSKADRQGLTFGKVKKFGGKAVTSIASHYGIPSSSFTPQGH